MSRRADSRASTFLFSVVTAKFLPRPFLTTKVSHIFPRHSELNQRSSSQKMVLPFLVSAGTGTSESFCQFAVRAFRSSPPSNSAPAANVARCLAASRVRYHSVSRATPLKRGSVGRTKRVPQSISHSGVARTRLSFASQPSEGCLFRSDLDSYAGMYFGKGAFSLVHLPHVQHSTRLLRKSGPSVGCVRS